MTAITARAVPYLMPLEQRQALLDAGLLDPDGYRHRLAGYVAATEPCVGAFVEFRPEAIIDTALPAAPSMTVKDNIDVDGHPTRLGIRAGYARTPTRSAGIVERLDGLGWVCVGKAATTECSLGSVKPSRNPRYPHVSPAGSSTGSACAVAAGFCDASVCTDSGGSLRWPSVYCGVTGLRLTPRPELMTGVHAVAPRMESVGLIARTPADLAWLWRTHRLWDQVGAAPQRPDTLRVAVSAPPGEALHPEVAALLRDVGRALGYAGHRVTTDDLAATWAHRAAAAALLAREAHDSFAELAARPDIALGADTRAAIAHGGRVDDRRYQALKDRQDEAAGYLAGVLTSAYDAVVQPLEPGLPDLVAAPGGPAGAGGVLPGYDDDPAGASLTLVASFARLPVLAVPLTLSSQRSPLGVQVLAAPGAEALLIDIGLRLETLARQGWFTRHGNWSRRG